VWAWCAHSRLRLSERFRGGQLAMVSSGGSAVAMRVQYAGTPLGLSMPGLVSPQM
jgi:hypothetical protein